MKNIITVLLVSLALTLTACNNESKNKNATPHYVTPNFNGHYLIEPFVLDGDCEISEPFEMVIWGDNVYENVEHQHISITGTIAGNELSGIVDIDTGEQAVFEALMIGSKSMSGDWYLTDGTCIGYLTGTRIVE